MSKAFHNVRRALTLSGFGAIAFMIFSAAAGPKEIANADGVPDAYKVRGTNYGVSAPAPTLPEFLPADAKPPHPTMVMAPRIRSEAGTLPAPVAPVAPDYDTLFPPTTNAAKPPSTANVPAIPPVAEQPVAPQPPPAPAVPATPSVQTTAAVLPELSRSEVARTIRERSSAMRSCYEGLLVRVPDARLGVTASFAISPVGTVQDLNLRVAGPSDAPFERCMRINLEQLMFPPGHALTNVSYPFRFSPEP